MDPSITTGVFTIAGVAIGGLFSIYTTRMDRRWSSAKRAIGDLANQVAAYHQLEALYIEEVARLNGLAPQTIQKQMRTQVEETTKFERPTMTSNYARKYLKEWGLK